MLKSVTWVKKVDSPKGITAGRRNYFEFFFEQSQIAGSKSRKKLFLFSCSEIHFWGFVWLRALHRSYRTEESIISVLNSNHCVEGHSSLGGSFFFLQQNPHRVALVLVGSLIFLVAKSPQGWQFGRVAYLIYEKIPTGSFIWAGLIFGTKEYIALQTLA